MKDDADGTDASGWLACAVTGRMPARQPSAAGAAEEAGHRSRRAARAARGDAESIPDAPVGQASPAQSVPPAAPAAPVAPATPTAPAGGGFRWNLGPPSVAQPPEEGAVSAPFETVAERPPQERGVFSDLLMEGKVQSDLLRERAVRGRATRSYPTTPACRSRFFRTPAAPSPPAVFPRGTRRAHRAARLPAHISAPPRPRFLTSPDADAVPATADRPAAGRCRRPRQRTSISPLAALFREHEHRNTAPVQDAAPTAAYGIQRSHEPAIRSSDTQSAARRRSVAGAGMSKNGGCCCGGRSTLRRRRAHRAVFRGHEAPGVVRGGRRSSAPVVCPSPTPTVSPSPSLGPVRARVPSSWRRPRDPGLRAVRLG